MAARRHGPGSVLTENVTAQGYDAGKCIKVDQAAVWSFRACPGIQKYTMDSGTVLPGMTGEMNLPNLYSAKLTLEQ
jgi:hypothetical protein